MKLWRKVVTGVLVVVVGAPLLFGGVVYGSAWYGRWRAGQLLACAKTIRPGVTTEAALLRDLRAVQNHVDYARYDTSIRPELVAIAPQRSQITHVYSVYNFPTWLQPLFDQTPEPGREFIGHYLSPDWAMFSVGAESLDGVVTGLTVREFSCRVGCGHPFASQVSIYSYRNSLDECRRLKDGPFNGYRVYQDFTDHFMGIQLMTPVLFKEYVLIDDRGTVEQRRKALDFHLQCFTNWSGCRDAAKMLEPLPNAE